MRVGCLLFLSGLQSGLASHTLRLTLCDGPTAAVQDLALHSFTTPLVYRADKAHKMQPADEPTSDIPDPPSRRQATKNPKPKPAKITAMATPTISASGHTSYRGWSAAMLEVSTPHAGSGASTTPTGRSPVGIPARCSHPHCQAAFLSRPPMVCQFLDGQKLELKRGKS